MEVKFTNRCHPPNTVTINTDIDIIEENNSDYIPLDTKISKFFFVSRGDSYKPNKHLNHIVKDSLIAEEFDLNDDN